MADSDALNVFVSSTMTELRDVRDVVRNELREKGIEGWVYEADAGARPEGVRDTSFEKVKQADIYLGLFWKDYGHVTIEEYLRARNLGKPCFIYVRDRNIQRDPALEDFLRREVYDLEAGVTYAYFDSAIELGKQAANDIMAWLVRQHRAMKAVREDENARYEQARQELDDTLRKLAKKLDESRQAKLRLAQEEWEKFCIANAEFMADSARDGTLGRLFRINTLADMAKARTMDLKKNLEP